MSGATELGRNGIRRRMRSESGQSLVLVIAAITVIFAMAAIAIDVAGWYQKHHQAQVAADAAALAAANCMYNAGQTIGTVPNACTSASDTPDAQTVATNVASTNGAPIPTSDVNFGSSTVTVTTPTVAPDFFANLFGFVSGTHVTARAAATWLLQDCGSVGSRCAFIFANDNVCSGDTGVTGPYGNGGGTTTVQHGVMIFKSGNSGNVTGGVISDASLNTSVNGGGRWSAEASNPSKDASGNTCVTPLTAGQSDPYSGTSTRTVPSTWPNDWPIDYSQTYPACSSSGTVQCDSNGFPSYCTVESTSATYTVPSTATANQVFCDAGPTGTPSDPSTWTGTITQSNSATSPSLLHGTYIAGIVNLNLPSNTTAAPAGGNQMLIYAAECNATRPVTCNSTTTTSPAVTITSNGNSSIQGDVWAPAGTIDASFGGTPVVGSFLESWDVVYNANGTVYGGGPTVNPVGQLQADYLVQ